MRARGEHRFEARERRIRRGFKAAVGDPAFDVGVPVQHQRDAFALQHELHIREFRVPVGHQIGRARQRALQYRGVDGRVADHRPFRAGRRVRLEGRGQTRQVQRRLARRQRGGDLQFDLPHVRDTKPLAGDLHREAGTVGFAGMTANGRGQAGWNGRPSQPPTWKREETPALAPSAVRVPVMLIGSQLVGLNSNPDGPRSPAGV